MHTNTTLSPSPAPISPRLGLRSEEQEGQAAEPDTHVLSDQRLFSMVQPTETQEQETRKYLKNQGVLPGRAGQASTPDSQISACPPGFLGPGCAPSPRRRRNSGPAGTRRRIAEKKRRRSCLRRDCGECRSGPLPRRRRLSRLRRRGISGKRGIHARGAASLVGVAPYTIKKTAQLLKDAFWATKYENN